MKVTNDTNSRKVEPRLAIYLGRSNGDESPSLDSLVIAAGPTSLCYQEDLNQLQQWSSQWLLQFHPDKCKWMCIRRGKEEIQREYHMTRPDGSKHTLERAQTEKDLGINIDESLTFDAHIQEKVNTATRMMAMIMRSFNYLDQENFRQLFKSLVKPILEYAQSVWCRVPVVSHSGRFTPTVVQSFHTQYFFQIRFFIVQISS